MTRQPRIRIGTRGSKLALAQANEVRRLLAAAHSGLDPEAIDIVTIKTTGDRVTDRPLATMGGKGLFTKEIEEALAAGEVDLAVHSMKDMPTILPAGLAITCLLEREDPRDVLISRHAGSLDALPVGAVVGTSSLRRQALVRARRPDLDVVPFRGNVDTRLEKVARGDVDATLLALAGLKRLGLADRATAILSTEEMLPAVAQGAIGIETRIADDRIAELLKPLNHRPTTIRIGAERAFLAALDGSCRTPIAAATVLTGDRLFFHGAIVTPDGTRRFDARREGAAAEAEAMGHDAGEELKARGGPDFFSSLG